MFLGIDIGTSGVKAVIVDDRGLVVDQASAPLAVSRPAAGWSEQEPEDWWTATRDAIGQLDAGMKKHVAAMGLAGQMHGATVLGDDDRPLRPAILWNDGRSAAECEALERAVPEARQIIGNLIMPGFTAPKLLWLKRHEPELFARVRTVLLPKDYVRLRLTGEKASDMSDSAGTAWLDVAKRDWSDAMLAATGLSRAAMPQLHEGSEATGLLRAEVAGELGLPRIPVAAGGGDNAAGAVGIGVVRPGDALLSLGTSGVIFAATDSFRPNPGRAVHAFCHCLPDMWHQMSVHLSAAACVDWAARLTGSAGPAALFDRAEAAGPAAGSELFLPYLSGERTPHNDPEIRGAFLGLDHETTPERLAEAVLEGVAFALADGLAALRCAGTAIDRLAVIGGGARSDYWGRIIASVLDVELDYLDGGEVGPALGAARLAQLAYAGGDPAAICTAPAVRRSARPEPAIAAPLGEKYARFRGAYRRLRTKDNPA